MTDLNPIRRKLEALKGRVVTAMLFDGAARVAGMLLACVVLSFALDRLFKLEAAARGVLLAAALGALAWVTWRFVVRRVRGVPDEDPLAIAVEARFRELNDRLISALQLARIEDPERLGMSRQLVGDAIEEAVEPVRQVRFREIVDRGRVAKTALLGLLALLLLAGGAAADRESASIWFRRNVLLRDVRWPQKTYLVVDEERFPNRVAHVVRGDDLVVTARSVGEVHPDRVELHYRDSEGDHGTVTMSIHQESRTYRHEFQDIAFPITFHLEGGDERTDPYRIELLEPPEVEQFEVTVGYPEYAGREPREIDLSAGDPEMLRDGFVVLRGVATKPLKQAHLVTGQTEEGRISMQVTGEKAFELTFRPEQTVLAGVRLRDTDGLSNRSLAPRFLVRVVDDRAPRLRFMKRGIGTMVVTGAVLPYLLRATDDVRVVEGRLEVRKSAGDRTAPEPEVVPIPAERFGKAAVELRGRLELGPMKLEPGAYLAIHAFATDNARPEAHESKSDPITVKVVTLEELFNELRRRQAEQRRLFEELIEREERLRDRFLDIRDQPPSNPHELRVRLEAQGQDQREIARRVHAVERAMEQIFDEMLYNRVYDEVRIGQLRRGVLRALETLRESTMSGHAQALDAAARGAGDLQLRGTGGDELRDGYERVLAAMRAVLSRMIKLADFTEIVQRFRDLIDAQTEVEKATKTRYDKALEELFGPGRPEDDGG